MLSKFKVYLLICFLFISVSGKSQITLRSCGMEFVVPVFNKTSLFGSEDFDLVKYGFLEPIENSKSKIEIRLYFFQYSQATMTQVIKCGDKGIRVETYSQGFLRKTSKTKETKKARNLGGVKSDSTRNFWVFTQKELRLSNLNWGKFFRQLSANRFFESVTGSELERKIKSVVPDIQPKGEGKLCIEVKINDDVRDLLFVGYDERATAILDYKNQLEIIQLLKSIK